MQTALVDMYAKSGLMELSRKVFDEMPDRDSVAWNALIAGYALNGYEREAIVAFRAMQVDGDVRPNASTFVSVIGLKGSGLGRSLHGLALKSGMASEETLVSALITMYAGIRDLAASRRLFDMVEFKDLVSWNTMISAYSQNEEVEEAFEMFRLMHCMAVRPNLVTMVSVLQSCGCLCGVHFGEMVHAPAIKLALAGLVSVATSLLTMYAKHGELDSARSLFREMPKKSLLLYNSMVSAYLHNGLPGLSLATFRNMQLAGLVPDSISIVSAVSGCSMCTELNLGRSIHAYSLRRGLDSNTSVMNALLAMYSDCDQFADTRNLFRSMRGRNVISWNTLITSCAKIGDYNSCVAAFRQMQEEVNFDLVTVISILPSFYRPEDLCCVMCFHGLAIKSGFESDTSLKNCFISVYSNSGDFKSAYMLFKRLSSSRTVVSWNALMTGYRNCGLSDQVMALLDQMRREGHKPNTVTLLNLLPSCRTKLQGKSIHAFAIRNLYRLESSLLTSSTMCMYARFEDLIACRLLFEMMEDKENVACWNTMMSAYAQSEDVARAVASFSEMLGMGVEPDALTMLSLASACSQLGSLVLAQSVTGFVVRKGFDKRTAVINVVIDMNARCGSLSLVRSLFDGLESKDSITWSTMINAYGMHGDGEAALRLFYAMQGVGMQPDDVTFVSTLSACSHSGLVEQGQVVFESMVKEHGIRPKTKHLACLIDLLGRTGHMNEAYEIVRRLISCDGLSVEMLESLLGACRSYGNVEVGEAVGKLVLLELRASSASTRVILSNIYATAERWRESGSLRCDIGAKGLQKDPGFSLVEVN